MIGLPTYYGNIVSEHADRHIDLIGIGRLFSMSRRPALNALASLRYRREFGQGRVYNLRMPEEQVQGEKKPLHNAIAPRHCLALRSLTHSWQVR